MNVPRAGQRPRCCPTVEVLAAGGPARTVPAVSSAELYNPATGTGSATGSIDQGRSGAGW